LWAYSHFYYLYVLSDVYSAMIKYDQIWNFLDLRTNFIINSNNLNLLRMYVFIFKKKNWSNIFTILNDTFEFHLIRFIIKLQSRASACEFIYACVRWHIHLIYLSYTYTYTVLYIYQREHITIYLYICIFMYNYKYIWLCVCVRACARAHVHICIYTHTHICVYICIYV